MRVTVIGPGAMGVLWAVRLLDSGAQVNILDYRPKRARQISEQGIFLEDGQEELHCPVSATADPAVLGQAELALVCVKAYQTAKVAVELGRHLNPQARALTLQNGAGNLGLLQESLGAGRVLGGITSEGSTLLGPGRARHAGRGRTHLGPAEGEVDGFTRQVKELFTRAGFATEATAGVRNLIWTKLVVNVGINALTALLQVPNGRLLELPAAGEIMDRAVEEAVGVGRELGIDFLHADMLAAVKEVAQGTAKNISSMLQDVRAQRRTEVDFINGAICRQAEALGIKTPVNHMLNALVQALEQDYL